MYQSMEEWANDEFNWFRLLNSVTSSIWCDYNDPMLEFFFSQVSFTFTSVSNVRYININKYEYTVSSMNSERHSLDYCSFPVKWLLFIIIYYIRGYICCLLFARILLLCRICFLYQHVIHEWCQLQMQTNLWHTICCFLFFVHDFSLSNMCYRNRYSFGWWDHNIFICASHTWRSTFDNIWFCVRLAV